MIKISFMDLALLRDEKDKLISLVERLKKQRKYFKDPKVRNEVSKQIDFIKIRLEQTYRILDILRIDIF